MLIVTIIGENEILKKDFEISEVRNVSLFRLFVVLWLGQGHQLVLFVFRITSFASRWKHRTVDEPRFPPDELT